MEEKLSFTGEHNEKKILRWILLCCVYFSLFLPSVLAQQVTLGTGTSTNGASAWPTTFGNYYWGNRHQILYKGSEMVAQGMTPNSLINSIAFNVANLNSCPTLNGYTVKIYLTSDENPLGAGYLSSTPQSITNFGNYTPTSGWNTLTLSTPVLWNGSDNIVIEICSNNSGWTSSGNASVTYTAMTPTSTVWTRYQYADSSGVCDNQSLTVNTTSNRPNMRLNFTPNTDNCGYIYNVVATSGSDNISLTWEGTGVSYEIEYGPAGFTLGSGTTIVQTGTSLTIPGLAANTYYDIYIEQLCADGTTAGFYGPINKKTECGIVVDSFYENFESTPTGSSSNNTHPACWSYVNTVSGSSTAYGYVSTTASYNVTGTKGFYTYRSSTSSANGDLLLISPETNNLGNGTKRLRFRAKKSSATYVPRFEIYTMNGNTASATKTLVEEVTLSTEFEEFIVYLPNTTDDYFAFSFDRVGTSASYVYLDDIYYEDAPSCIPVTSITVSNVFKFNADVSWTPTLTTATATYTWELRTSGDPGSGAAGLVQSGTTAAGVTSLNLTSLSAGTTYYFYVRANCTTSDSSAWDEEAIEFTTICDYPDITSLIAPDICGIGTSDLEVESTSGIVQWFLTENGAVAHEGNTFTTPVIDETTTFYVRTGVVQPNTQIQVGTGTGTSSSSGSSPYATGWGGYKTQYIFTAEELLAAGLAAGPINKVGFDVATTTDQTRNGFTIHIGTTTQSTATSTHVAGLTQVYSNAEQSISLGINNYTFTTPFNWDGTSNIVVQVSWSNNNTGQTGGVVRYHTAPATRTTYTYADNRTPAQVLATMTGGVANDSGATSGGTTTTSSRANTYFNGVGLCTSPLTPVTVTVTPAENFELSANELVVCQGNESEVLTITEGADVYDTFVFTPSTGVSGNAQDGWIIVPQEDTTYSVIASQSDGNCSKEFLVNVIVTEVGYENLEESYITCIDDTLELSVLSEDLSIDILPAEPLQTFSFEDATDLGVTLSGTNTSIAQSTTVSTLGSSSLKWSYQNNAAGELTLNETFDASQSYGLVLEFDHIAILESNSWDWGHVQYSLDGGTTWVNFQLNQYLGQGTGMVAGATGVKFSRTTYSSWSGITAPNANLWKTEKFFLTGTSNDLSNVKFRFTLRSDGSGVYDGWYIDNVRVKSVNLPNIIWSPASHLFLDEELTQPYSGESIGKVYFNHDQAGNYPITVNISNSTTGCAAVVNTEVVIPSMEFPGLTNSYYCDVTPVEDLEFNAQVGVNYIWYNSIFSQTPLTEIPFSGTYYVEIEAGDCSSSRQPVDIYIIGDVNVSVDSNQLFCDSATVADLVATPSDSAATVYWYDSEDATTPMSATTSLVSGQTYYVNQVLHGCSSAKLPVNVTIAESPEPIDFSELSVCANSTIGSVVLAEYPTLHWYNSPTAVTPLTNQAVLTNGIYYIANFNGQCDSERIPVTVTVVMNLEMPQVTVINICGSGTVADLDQYVANASPVAELRWYLSSTSTTPLTPEQVLSTGTYYVEHYLTGCSSARRAVSVRVVSQVAPLINAQQVCQGTTVGEIDLPAPSGITYQWYTSPSSTTALAPNSVLTTGNYYVRRVQYGCTSDATTVSVTVLPTPAAPTGETSQVLPMDSILADIVMNQSNVTWYITEEDALSGTNPLDSDMPLVDGQTYYGVIISENGCSSLPTAVTITLYLGINDLDIASLHVYPNPTKNILNISYKETIDRIEVFSMLGQRVLDVKVDNIESSIDLSHLATGTYMVKVTVGENNQLVKVVKN